MKVFLIIFQITFSFNSFSQPKIEFNSEKTNTGFIILANNSEFCSVSVRIKFQLKNLLSSNGDEFIFLVPPKTNQFKITDFNIVNKNDGFSYSYDVVSTFGDVTLTKYDSNYQYGLPFEKGNEFQVQQGYFGKYTHQKERSLDIDMPKGTRVVAARKGMIISQVDYNNKHCTDPSCLKYNNYIDIIHVDGTIANYSHLKFKSCKYQAGDVVEEGYIIAESDQTGYTSGPHLHFIAYLPAFENKKSISTLFKINNGDEFSLLQEKQFYFKNY